MVNFYVTGIGSLPYNRDELYTGLNQLTGLDNLIPWVPQARGEELIGQHYDNVYNSVMNDPEMTQLLGSNYSLPLDFELNSGIPVLGKLIETEKTHIVKYQITGPITTHLARGGDLSLITEIASKVGQGVYALFKYVMEKSGVELTTERDEIAKRQIVKNIICFYDEPSLRQSILDPNEIWESLYGVLNLPCKRGIHICDDPSSTINQLLSLPLHYISMDVYSFRNALKGADDLALTKYVHSGGSFAFGVFPSTLERFVPLGELEMFYKRKIDVRSLEKHLPSKESLKEVILDNLQTIKEKTGTLPGEILLTHSCGCKSLPREFVYKTFEVLSELSKGLNSGYCYP